MKLYFPIIICLAGSPAGNAQQWFKPANTSMCNWALFRAAPIRDTLYIDGGSLWWNIGLSDNGYELPQNDGNSQGTLFTFPLTNAFDTTITNLTSLFSRQLQPNITPTNFKDGTMFATYNKFLLFGGLTPPTDSRNVPGPRDLLGYEKYQYGPHRANWEPGFIQPELPPSMSRYITNGGGVSIPSENLGFYFGGLHGVNWDPIMADGSANVSSPTLISVDLSQMGHEHWQNATLPSNIKTRANAEVAWLPVSSQGILAVIGGVVHPEDVYPDGLSDSQVKNEVGPTFFRTIPIYDIARRKWYLQNTTGDLPPHERAQFCTVVASSPDRSSHNIYLYGGYDGSTADGTPYDDVYILSIPSFTWFRVYSGTLRHGRRGHKCIKVFPDQMLVIGGRSVDPTVCLDGGIVQVFNLNTLQFQNQYHPNRWSDYRIPQVVVDHIGGSSRGGATRTAPTTWHSPTLASVFETPYTKPISTWFPYTASAAPTETLLGNNKRRRRNPKWFVPILLAVIIPVCATAATISIWLWRYKLRHTPASPSKDSLLKKWLTILGIATRNSRPVEADGKQVEVHIDSHPCSRGHAMFPPGLPDIPELPAEESSRPQTPASSSICLTPVRNYPDKESQSPEQTAEYCDPA